MFDLLRKKLRADEYHSATHHLSTWCMGAVELGLI